MRYAIIELDECGKECPFLESLGEHGWKCKKSNKIIGDYLPSAMVSEFRDDDYEGFPSDCPLSRNRSRILFLDD